MADAVLMYATYCLALIAGTVLVGSVAFSNYRSKSWSFPSLGAVALGVALMGMSVWSQVKVTVEGNKVTAEYHRLEQQNADLAAAVLDLDDAVRHTRKTVALRAIEPGGMGGSIDPGAIALADSLWLQPSFDRAVLREIVNRPGLR